MGKGGGGKKNKALKDVKWANLVKTCGHIKGRFVGRRRHREVRRRLGGKCSKA